MCLIPLCGTRYIGSGPFTHNNIWWKYHYVNGPPHTDWCFGKIYHNAKDHIRFSPHWWVSLPVCLCFNVLFCKKNMLGRHKSDQLMRENRPLCTYCVSGMHCKKYLNTFVLGIWQKATLSSQKNCVLSLQMLVAKKAKKVWVAGNFTCQNFKKSLFTEHPFYSAWDFGGKGTFVIGLPQLY